MSSIPRNEHPNPQFERKNYVNLNGKWQFEIDNGDSGMDRKLFDGETLADEIIVPFCPESELSGINNKDFMNAVWYKRSFTLLEKFKNHNVFINFGAVDFMAQIFVNGIKAGEHKGGYSSFSVEVTNFVKEGENILTVYAKDETRSPLQASGKQSTKYNSHGCSYTRTTGIWQTVWMEFVPKIYIENVKYYTNIEDGTLAITANVKGSGVFTAKAYYEGKQVGSESAKCNGGNVNIIVKLAELHLWEVGKGRLYDLELTYGDDEVSSYFGMRSVRLDNMKFLINEKSVFQRLVLDQGFYPDGIYTAPTKEDLVRDIKLSLDMGFNGARLHEKIFEPRFLYYCDKMGYIVWGEHGNWGMDHANPYALLNYIKEWKETVNRDFNHPAIIGWCPYNETWDYEGRPQSDDFIKMVYETTKEMDHTRPCIDTSGNFHVITDIFDVHDYEQNTEIFKEHYAKLESEKILHNNYSARQTYRGEPVFVSEYGGICWNVDKIEGWGYGVGPKTEEEFINRYKALTDVLLDNGDIFGFCYTQLYDVEQEVNGLYTYGRTAKFAPEIIKEINSRKAKIEK